jgi:hypothetical protein
MIGYKPQKCMKNKQNNYDHIVGVSSLKTSYPLYFTNVNCQKESVDWIFLGSRPNIGLGRLIGLPTKEFKACLSLSHTMTAATSSTVKENSGSNHKLTRVVSTKLSIEDDDFLQYITTLAYQDGRIKEPSKSELVRYFVTLSLSIVRKEIPFLVTQKQRSI